MRSYQVYYFIDFFIMVSATKSLQNKTNCMCTSFYSGMGPSISCHSLNSSIEHFEKRFLGGKWSSALSY